MELGVYAINSLLHTEFGSVALAAGLFALAVIKGSKGHKKAGMFFSTL